MINGSCEKTSMPLESNFFLVEGQKHHYTIPMNIDNRFRAMVFSITKT